MFNSSGQAFSVFKLLIAAVVAVVILTLLLSIIGRIDIIGQRDPQEEAGKIVNAIAPQRAVVRISGEVIFNPNTGISNRGVASATRGSLADNQVCVLVGDFQDEEDRFQYQSGVSVIYTGSSAQNAAIIAICDTGSAMYNDRDYFRNYTGERGITDARDCGCIDPDFNQKCCVVALKRYRG